MEYWLPTIWGYEPFNIFNAKTGKELASNGNFSEVIWYRITPNAQISALVE